MAILYVTTLCLKKSGSLLHFRTRMWAMPNVMVALPNIGGALCSTPQSLAVAYY